MLAAGVSGTDGFGLAAVGTIIGLDVVLRRRQRKLVRRLRG
jgi:hypothetical protein